MNTLFFIRHGATRGNLQKRYIGKTDEELCEKGIQQTLKLCDHNFPDEYIFISPMKRTRQTAEIIFPEGKFITEYDFREIDFGDFEGKTYLELKEDFAYNEWVESMCMGQIPDGEGVVDFKKRCVAAFEKIIKSLPCGKGATFVIHGGVIMAIMEAFAENEGAFYDYHIDNGDFFECCFNNGKIMLKTEKI